MDDGVSIAATLYVPDGTPPAGGWPAIVFLHGLAGNRQQMNALVEGYGFTGGSYAILTFDARGHGESGGLVGIDGPREIADTRAVHDWLAARPDVSDTRIGAWGISYGGGAVFNSLVAGVPWAAVATVETWTDLYSALMPQGLVKSGPRRRALELDSRRAARSVAGACSRRQRSPGMRQSVKPWAEAALEPVQARHGHDACVHGARTPRLPLRNRPGRASIQAAQGPEGAVRRPARARSIDLPGRRHRVSHVAGALLVRLLPRTDALLTRARGVRDRLRDVLGQRPVARNAPAGLTHVRLVPRRHDLRAERKGRSDIRAAPQGDRDLRDADRADVDRGERRLVAARRRPHGSHAAGEGDPRRRRRRPHEGRRSEGHDPAREPGDVRPEGLATHRSRWRRRRPRSRARTSSTSISRWRRALGHASARPSSSSRACARRSRSDRASRGCRARGACARRERRRRHRSRPRRHVVDRSARRHRPADGRGGGVRDGRARRESLLRLREREGRRQRPNDRVPLLGRRLQPGADRPAHPAPRRAGQGVRDLQLGRNGEQPRDPRLPERAEGARSSSPPTARSRSAAASPSTRGRWASS